jgi:ferredoxin
MTESIIHFCTADDMHPYNCYGQGKCIHCDKAVQEDHDPNSCPLCNYLN